MGAALRQALYLLSRGEGPKMWPPKAVTLVTSRLGAMPPTYVVRAEGLKVN